MSQTPQSPSPSKRSTPAGTHQPILADLVVRRLALRPGGVYVDCTVGYGGHAERLLAVEPTATVIGLDRDAEQLARTGERLAGLVASGRLKLYHANFAALPTVLAIEGSSAADGVLADLGVSSMQMDEAERGFSIARPGPLDMRLDRSKGEPASQVLAKLSADELTDVLSDYGDEPNARRIAATIARRLEQGPIETTDELAQLIAYVVEGSRGRRGGSAKGHPAIRTFQAIRILVNREFEALEGLLRALPGVLAPHATAVIISFHSGEDRRVKAAFTAGHDAGDYDDVARRPELPEEDEVRRNPRSRSAKLRWARRAKQAALEPQEP